MAETIKTTENPNTSILVDNVVISYKKEVNITQEDLDRKEQLRSILIKEFNLLIPPNIESSIYGTNKLWDFTFMHNGRKLTFSLDKSGDVLIFSRKYEKLLTKKGIKDRLKDWFSVSLTSRVKYFFNKNKSNSKVTFLDTYKLLSGSNIVVSEMKFVEELGTPDFYRTIEKVKTYI